MSKKRGIGELVADGEYMEAWRKFKDENPEAYTAAAIAPVSGQMAAMADYADAMDRSDSADGVAAAVSLIPGVKLMKVGGRALAKLAPSSLELGIAKSLAPSSSRARLAPVTERADKIGKAAAAEQVAEYADGRMTSEQADQRGREYAKAWKADPPSQAKGKPDER